MRFLAFERTSGHCQITLLSGQSLTHALAKNLVANWEVMVDERGWIVDGDDCEHPLEFIEREIKADPDEGELAVNIDNCSVVNEHSFEVRVLPDGALDAGYANVFTTAEPGYTAGEVMRACAPFARAFPDVNAHTFFWYLRDGVLVTFYTLEVGEEGRKINIIARYLTKSDDEWSAEPWTGTFEDLAEQMTFETPF